MNTHKTTLLLKTLAAAAFLTLLSGCYICEPGERGLKVTLGQREENLRGEGWGLYNPLITDVHKFSIKQNTKTVTAPCFSSDLQQVTVKADLLYALPEDKLIELYVKYQGDPFNSLIVPRFQEAMKEVAAQYSAERLVRSREEVKQRSLEVLRAKVGDILRINDLAINNIDLSNELEKAIEQKMVQEQEAAKAKFVQQKAQIEAETAIIKAKGEAEAIRIRGEALKQSPELIQLQIVEKWNGVAPLVIGGAGEGSNIILPLGNTGAARTR